MAEITADQFKVNHLRQRIAKLSVDHEDVLAEMAMQAQYITQQRDEAVRESQELAARVLQLEAELAELKEDEPENSPEEDSDETSENPSEEDPN